jgi:hypothetical protein
MKVARQHARRDAGGEIEVDYEGVELPARPRRLVAREMTPAEVRRQRDLVWLMLADRGLSAREIAEICSVAARHRDHIARRVKAARKAVARAR